MKSFLCTIILFNIFTNSILVSPNLDIVPSRRFLMSKNRKLVLKNRISDQQKWRMLREKFEKITSKKSSAKNHFLNKKTSKKSILKNNHHKNISHISSIIKNQKTRNLKKNKTLKVSIRQSSFKK